MAKGYWIANIDVHDLENYRAYMAASTEAVASLGGRFIVRGGAARRMEGEARERHVVIEFPSYEEALAAYGSAEYQAALALRLPFASADVVIVEGAP